MMRMSSERMQGFVDGFMVGLVAGGLLMLLVGALLEALTKK